MNHNQDAPSRQPQFTSTLKKITIDFMSTTMDADILTKSLKLDLSSKMINKKM